MIDLRPVGYVIGLLVMVLGATMLVPLAVDIAEGRGEWPTFAESAIITLFVGAILALSCANSVQMGLDRRQTFLLTTLVWLVLPIFGAIPLVIGATEARFVDAFFEAMSGLTTTGSTVLTGLDDLPKGILLWRGILQWLGGIGIVVVAMVFLPELGVGGMQVFRSEGFDTRGKILSRATEISARISTIYIVLTLACVLSYMAVGMNFFDATVHAMTTISTGGFSNYDASFGTFSGTDEWVASVFMILAALPFVRYVQLTTGTARPLLLDSQIHAFFLILLGIVGMIAAWHVWTGHITDEGTLRETVFNSVSILTGTGYASVDYMTWGGFPVVVIFFAGLVGGCSGSTACSVKVFRYQILFAAIRAQFRRIMAPHGVFTPKFEGRPVEGEVVNSVMAFFTFFVLTLGVLSVALSLTGLDTITAVSSAATAVANIGPGLGPQVGPSGNFAGLSDTAKWLMAAGMLIGRLELLTVYVLFTTTFWRE